MEEEYKKKIKDLYQQLIDKEKGEYVPGSGYGFILPPNGISYYMTASKIMENAIELSKINNKYHTENLAHTISKEVEYVRDFEYRYDKDAKSPNKRSINEMISLMRSATGHIFRDFVAMLD